MFHHQGPLGPLDGPVASPSIPGNIQGLGGSGPKAGPRQPGFRRRLRNPQVTAYNGRRLGHLGSNWGPSGASISLQ